MTTATALQQLDLLAGAEVVLAPPPTDASSLLCSVCHERPRHAGGALSRCLPCIKSRAAEDRQDRLRAEATLAERLALETKVCRTCKKPRHLGEYAPHPLGKDGRRAHCRRCVASGQVKRKELSAEQRTRDRARRKTPEARVRNLEAAHSWQARNPDAVTARKAVSKAVKGGALTRPSTCQALGCNRRKGLHGHHNSYSARNRTKVIWLCNWHHQQVHVGLRLKTKAAAVFTVAKAPKTS